MDQSTNKTDMATRAAGRDAAGRLLSADDLDVLLRAGTLAPSLHNSQPWSFAADAQTVELYADGARQLIHADPSGRSLLISCGAALFNLRVAAEHLGFRPHVTLLPEADDPMLLARLDLGRRRTIPAGLDHFYPAIPARRTNRGPFSDRSIPHTVMLDLVEAVRAEDALVRVYDQPDEVARIVALLHDADLAERGDLARTTERQAWIGGPHRHDGIPVRSLGPRPTRLGSPYRDLGRTVSPTREHASFEAAPTVAVLSTRFDAPTDWLRAGEALERLLLAATLAGLSASFLNQALEQDDLRWLVRSPITGAGHSQMILRLGYGGPVPPTPRRPLEDVRRERPRS